MGRAPFGPCHGQIRGQDLEDPAREQRFSGGQPQGFAEKFEGSGPESTFPETEIRASIFNCRPPGPGLGLRSYLARLMI